MKVTIVYDNEVKSRGLKAGWGFSSLIETGDTPPLLFDTGADSPTLLHNMGELGIDARDIGIIVISHAHGDHTGGLRGILEVNKKAKIYVPASLRGTIPGRKVITVTEPLQISEGVFSTGELKTWSSLWQSKRARGFWWWWDALIPGLEKLWVLPQDLVKSMALSVVFMASVILAG